MEIPQAGRAQIRRYLDAVRARLAQLSEPERVELLADIESHIHEALAARGPTPTAADLAAVLAEMPPPDSYLPDEQPAAPVPPPSTSPESNLGRWALTVALIGVAGPPLLAAIGAIFASDNEGRETAYGIAAVFWMVMAAVALVLGVWDRRTQTGRAAIFVSAAALLLAVLLAGWLLLADTEASPDSARLVARQSRSQQEKARVVSAPVDRPEYVQFPHVYRPGRPYRLIRTERISAIPDEPGQFLQTEMTAIVHAGQTAESGTPLRIRFTEFRSTAQLPWQAALGWPREFTSFLIEGGVLAEFRAHPPSTQSASPQGEPPIDLGAMLVELAAGEPTRYLPAGPVRVGDTWQVSKDTFWVSGPGGISVFLIQTFDKAITCRFDGLRTENSRELAIIQLSAKSSVIYGWAAESGSIERMPVDAGDLTFELTGELAYDLNTGELVSHVVSVKSMEPDNEGILCRCEIVLQPSR